LRRFRAAPRWFIEAHIPHRHRKRHRPSDAQGALAMCGFRRRGSVGRRNISGGRRAVFDARRRLRLAIYHAEPWSMLLMDDARGDSRDRTPDRARERIGVRRHVVLVS